jgi:hypothetical protein
MVEATLGETLFWSILRALLVASCALLPLLVLRRAWEGTRSSRARSWIIAAAALPFFIPELLTGFHYRVQAAVWASELAPSANAAFAEGLYGLLQLLRAVSAGTIVLLLLPQNPATAGGLHTWKLLRPVLPRRHWISGQLRLLVSGVLAAPLAAWSVMAITVFQEFETAALMQIDRHPLAWTVWMFDAHAAQQPLAESLRMSTAPLAVEFLLLLPLLPALCRTRGTDGRELETWSAGELRPASRLIHILAGSYGLAAAIILIGIPQFRLGAETLSGVRLLVSSARLLQQSLVQVLTSTAVSAAAALTALSACTLAARIRHQSNRNRIHRMLLPAIILLPGLAGPLATSLTLLALFQTPPLRPLYDTWLPLLLGLTLAVLPRALALQLLLERFDKSEAIHSAEQLGLSPTAGVRSNSSSILWRLIDLRRLGALLLLTQWCFWNVTSTSILRPLDPEPAITRLYNEMHFARTEVLLGLTALSALAPGVLFVSGLYLRWCVRKKRTRS